MKRLALLLPWLTLAVIVALIVWDQQRTRDSARAGDVGDELLARAVAAEPADDAVARDPVCRMQVRRAAAPRAVVADRSFYFCCSPCRDDFVRRPAHYLAAVAAGPPTGHRMRGLPTWMAQAGLALVLLLSFGLLQRLPAPDTAQGPMAARWRLTGFGPLRRALKSPALVPLCRLLMVALFVLVIAAGLFGTQDPAVNIAPLLTWTVWWAGLIFAVLYFGKAWCTVCPWDAIATWLERLKLWGPRREGEGLGLDLPWPRRLRNIWFAVAMFVGLTWIELGMGVTLIPRATAWIALGITGLAVASVFVFERKAFCRYACLVGRISGLYALFSPVELRATDAAVCASCTTADCFRGNDAGDGCPTFEFPKTMQLSTYCTLCTECVKTCPHDNIHVQLRPWGTDLVKTGEPRADEAMLAMILLAMTGFHGLTMTPRWADLNARLQLAWGLPPGVVFAALMFASIAAPILLYLVLVRVSAVWGRPHGTRALFIHYAYAMLPIALFYHLAHNAEHLLMEGPRIMALVSDPFGWGWDVFGTAGRRFAPLVTLEGLWWIQILLVLVGHVFSLWIAEHTTRRLLPDRGQALRSQLPMLLAMVAFSWFSLWLLSQPMEMRLSAM